MSLTHGNLKMAILITENTFCFWLWKALLWSLRSCSNQHSSFSMATQISASETKRGLITQAKKVPKWHKHREVSTFLKSRKGHFLCNAALKNLQTHSHVIDRVRLNQVHQNRNGARTGLWRDGTAQTPWLPSSELAVPFRIHSS